MNDREKEFINNHHVARLSTVDSEGAPHVVPIVYAFNDEVIFTPVDSKPKKIEGIELQRVKNIQKNSSVSLIIDDYSRNWNRLAWVQVRGKARLVTEGTEYEKGVDLLLKKYPQYNEMNLSISMLIIISPTRVLSWQV